MQMGHTDMTSTVDWVLKANYLSIHANGPVTKDHPSFKNHIYLISDP